MTWRIRIPSALYRLAVDHAGGDGPLAQLVTAYIERLVAGQTDAQVTGAAGGRARAANLSAERRREIAEQGARARWTRQPTE